ncbi:MAG: ribonuclease P protein component [Terriglobales bacterium]
MSAAEKQSLRFPRTARLLKHAAYQQVYEHGRRLFSGRLTVFYLGRTDTAGPRVGLTVSRALGNSVERNRIRRRLREAVRLCLGKLNAPVDVVINPKKSVLTTDFTGLVQEMERAFTSVQHRAGNMAPVRAARRTL